MKPQSHGRQLKEESNMKSPVISFKLMAAATLLVALIGCESTGGGNISSGTNYGTGMNDPWPSPTIVNPTTGASPGPQGPSGGR